MKRAILVCLFICVTFTASANPLAAYAPRVGAAISGLIASKLAQRGISAVINGGGAAGATAINPQYSGTVQAVSVAATGLVTAGVTLAGAPLWATIAVGTAAAVAVPLAVDGAYKWLSNGDGTVTPVTVSAGAVNITPPPIGSNDTWYCGGLTCASSINAVAAAEFKRNMTWPWMQSLTITGIDVQVAWWGTKAVVNYTYLYQGNQPPSPGSFEVQISTSANGAPACVQSGGLLNTNDQSCGSAPSSGGTPQTGTPTKLSDAAAAIPDAEKAKPVHPKWLADAANKAWAAAGSAAGAVPYDPSNPITEDDVKAWQAGSAAGSYPTVGDFVGSAVDPATGTVSLPTTGVQTGAGAGTGANTGATTGTNAGTQTGTGSQVNLGVDPLIGAPILEATPTASAILKPLIGLFPDLRSFVVPSHQSTCPQPSITWLNGQTLTLSSHCDVLEGQRNTLYAVMAVVWLMAAMFIILRA